MTRGEMSTDISHNKEAWGDSDWCQQLCVWIQLRSLNLTTVLKKCILKWKKTQQLNVHIQRTEMEECTAHSLQLKMIYLCFAIWYIFLANWPLYLFTQVSYDLLLGHISVCTPDLTCDQSDPVHTWSHLHHPARPVNCKLLPDGAPIISLRHRLDVWLSLVASGHLSQRPIIVH